MLILVAALLASAPPRSSVVTIVRQTIVRIRGAAAPASTLYHEKRGPRCIAAADIGGAAVTGPQSIDFGLHGGGRVRAQLEDACPALDFYRGFYVAPGSDGKVCADRDAIRTRSGGECGIDRFRKLVPADKPPAP